MSTPNAYASTAFGELPLDNAIQVQVVQEGTQVPVVGFGFTFGFNNSEGRIAALNAEGKTGWGNNWYMLQPGRLVLDVSARSVRDLRFELGADDAHRVIDAEGPRGMIRSHQVWQQGTTFAVGYYTYRYSNDWINPNQSPQVNPIEIGAIRTQMVVETIDISHKGLYRPKNIPRRNANGRITMTIEGDVIGLQSRGRLQPVVLADGTLHMQEDAVGMVIIRYETEVVTVKLEYACWPVSLLRRVRPSGKSLPSDPYSFPDLLPLELEAFAENHAFSSGWQAVLQRQPPVIVGISERQRPWIKQVVTHQRNGG